MNAIRSANLATCPKLHGTFSRMETPNTSNINNHFSRDSSEDMMSGKLSRSIVSKEEEPHVLYPGWL